VVPLAPRQHAPECDPHARISNSSLTCKCRCRQALLVDELASYSTSCTEVAPQSSKP
jgi:hypothetical protein